MTLLKQWVTMLVKGFGLLLGPFLAPPRAPVTVFTLHRISSDQVGEMMLTPKFVARFLAAVKARYEVVSWGEYLVRAQAPKGGGPLAVLTVDDAFSDAFTELYPILQKLHLPITLFVPTQFMQQPEQVPVSFAYDPALYRPCSWAQLRSMQASGLVTLAAHSHAHVPVNQLTAAQIDADTALSQAIFASQGLPQPRLYAYPRGVFTASAAAVLSKHYESAFAGAPHHALPPPLAHMAVARVPIRGSDQALFWRFKVCGWPTAEEWLIERIKRLAQRLRGR